VAPCFIKISNHLGRREIEGDSCFVYCQFELHAAFGHVFDMRNH
jgi:hypothetical protein